MESLLVDYYLGVYKDLLWIESFLMASKPLKLLRRSLEYWSEKLNNNESQLHDIRQTLVSHLSTELEEGGCLYAALAFHVALHKIGWQFDDVDDGLKMSSTVESYASAVAPKACNKEMWKRSIMNELWESISVTDLHLTDSQNKHFPLLKGWPIEGNDNKTHILPLLRSLTPPEFHSNLVKGKEIVKGSDIMIELDERVKEYLQGESEFPQLWKSLQVTERRVKVSIILELADHSDSEARESHHFFDNLDTLQSDAANLISQVVSEFMAGLKDTQERDERSSPDGVTEHLRQSTSYPEKGQYVKFTANGGKDAFDPEPLNNHEESNPLVEEYRSKLWSQVRNTKILYEDYNDSIKYLGPTTSMPERPKETNRDLGDLVCLSREIVKCERKIHRTWPLRSWARELIIGSLGSLNVLLNKEPDSDLYKAARMIVTSLAEISLFHQDDGERICSYLIILLSGKVLSTSQLILADPYIETTPWEILKTVAQSPNLSSRYRKCIKDLADEDLPLSGLDGFSIWKVLRSILPDTSQREVYTGNIEDDNVLELLLDKMPGRPIGVRGTKRRKESVEEGKNQPLEERKRQRRVIPVPATIIRKSQRIKK